MIELKLTPHQASVVWAALLVAEDNALDNARGSGRQKALDMANEIRALRHEITLRREALREQA
jgi:hypothetical protein